MLKNTDLKFFVVNYMPKLLFMALHNELGKDGELAAVNFLKSIGYALITTNWRVGKYEIDIIAKEKDTLVFIEVKTRKTAAYGHPSEFLSLKQMRNIMEAAEMYMQKNNISLNARFDLVTLLKESGKGFKIEHFPAAFSAYEL